MAVVPITIRERQAIQPTPTTERIVAMWLHGRPASTQATYAREASRFLRFVDKPMNAVTLEDVQDFADSISRHSPATQARVLATVRSLFTFAHKRLGILPVNVAGGVLTPKAKDTLAERILTEEQVQKMLALETNPRDRTILRLLYGAGVRVSELCGILWRDLQPRPESTGQVTVYGKGQKTRTILLSAATWGELQALRHDAGNDEPVFRSRKGGGPLTRQQVFRIIKKAGKRAGLPAGVSPHWMRHSHASHALDRGAPVHLVQQTLGHESLTTTSRYTHARPNESSSKYLGV